MLQNVHGSLHNCQLVQCHSSQTKVLTAPAQPGPSFSESPTTGADFPSPDPVLGVATAAGYTAICASIQAPAESRVQTPGAKAKEAGAGKPGCWAVFYSTYLDVSCMCTPYGVCMYALTLVTQMVCSNVRVMESFEQGHDPFSH